MELTHRFTVPASVEETWAAFENIEGVAECFPGAQVTSVEGDTFKGTVKVKLGPIALVYNGSGEFVEKDQSAGRMVIAAKGKDKRGNGTAGADVVATMSEVSDTETKVVVVTDLSITGKPAQFGRGVIQDISDKLLGQFVECLKTKVGDDNEPEAEVATEGEAAPVPSESVPSEPDSSEPAAPPSSPGGTHAARPSGTAPAGSSSGTTQGSDDALDLGATVVPILLRTYGKQLAATLGVLALIVWIARRR